MRSIFAVFLTCAILLSASARPSWSTVALAQEIPEMPPLGRGVVDDALAGSGPFRPRTCQTGRNSAAYADEGLRMNVTGPCTDGAVGAGIPGTASGLFATNGELSIEAKLVEGYERGWLTLFFREQGNGDLYALHVIPFRRWVELRKTVGSIGALVAERTDVDVMPPDTWTRIGVRLEGQRIWVLLNDQPVLSATDPTLSRGGFSIGVGRFGNVQDDAPVTAIWRNVRVTALANEPTPAATTGQPARPAGAPDAFVPASGTPPAIGRIVHEESLRERGIIPSGTCPTGRARGEVVGEGFLLAVRGKCTEASTDASVTPRLTGLTVPDGEIRFEFKVTSGYERSSMALGVRKANDTAGSYVFGIVPGAGRGYITRVVPGQPGVTLSQRSDLAGLLRRDDWNTMSIRVQGSNLWLLVNEQAVVSVQDGSFDTGMVWVGLARLNSPDDEEEVAIVFRNFVVAAIEGAPEDRAPSYSRPPLRPSGPGSDMG